MQIMVRYFEIPGLSLFTAPSYISETCSVNIYSLKYYHILLNGFSKHYIKFERNAEDFKFSDLAPYLKNIL